MKWLVYFLCKTFPFLFCIFFVHSGIFSISSSTDIFTSPTFDRQSGDSYNNVQALFPICKYLLERLPSIRLLIYTLQKDCGFVSSAFSKVNSFFPSPLCA